MKKYFFLILSVLTIGMMNSCSKDDGPAMVQEITLDKVSAEINVGDTLTLTAKITPENANDKSLAWSSTDESVATISPKGVVSAVGVGNAVIKVTANDKSGKFATCTVTVLPAKVGTAKRTGDINVNWVQLWKNGPKFAEYNVGRLDKKTTPSQMLDKIKAAYAKAKQEGKPAIYDFGWNYETFETVGMPTLSQLDEACPDIPLYISDDEGQNGFANSACMVKAGIKDSEGKLVITEIPGGEINVDELGNPTGLFKEKACTFCITNGIGADYLLLIGGKVEDFGGYYCWGSSIDKDPNASYNKGESALSGTDDTATNLWGSNWRMPTQAELQALLDNCDVEWTTVNGVNGRKFTGKGNYASNSIFLPAASNFSSGNLGPVGTDGNYWSSTQLPYDRAQYLGFIEPMASMFDNNRNNGYSVRAVLAE